MSSKFRDLLVQARNRSSEDELPDDSDDAHSREEEADRARASAPTLNDGRSSTPSQAAHEEPPAAPPEPSLEPETVLEALHENSFSRRGRPRNGKRSDPNFTQITAYISKKTHQSVKVALLGEGEGKELSQLIEECLLFWLEHHE